MLLILANGPGHFCLTLAISDKYGLYLNLLSLDALDLCVFLEIAAGVRGLAIGIGVCATLRQGDNVVNM